MHIFLRVKPEAFAFGFTFCFYVRRPVPCVRLRAFGPVPGCGPKGMFKTLTFNSMGKNKFYAFLCMVVMAVSSAFVFSSCSDDDGGGRGDVVTVIQSDDGRLYDGTLYYDYVSETDRTVAVSGSAGDCVDLDVPGYISLNGTVYTVTSVGIGAFNGQDKLVKVDLPQTLALIDDYAFYGCSSLSSISLPSRVETIGSFAFGNCTSLAAVTLPDDLATIDYCAFYGCTSLTFVTLPSRLSYIGQQAFSTSGQLREIYSYITNPADGNYHANSFVDIENAILFVPKGTVDEYEQLSPWNKARLITEMSGR